jgi:hypothetical protein
VQNQVDALSRQLDHVSLLAISSSTSPSLDECLNFYNDDPHYQQLLTKLSTNPQNDKDFSLSKGILCYLGHIQVGFNPTAQAHILQAL